MQSDRVLVVSDGAVEVDGVRVPCGVYEVSQDSLVMLPCDRVLVRYKLTEIDGVELVRTEALDERLGCGEL